MGQTDEKDARTAPAVGTGISRPALWPSPWLHAPILICLVAVTFGRALGNYFLADDFCQIAYVGRIFAGDSGLFWSNFTGNYMQIPGMNVYRPWLLCSLVNDWLFYHGQAWGYYLTNLIYFTAVVLLLYAVARQLTRDWGAVRSSVTAILAACLFIVNPLRAESISWVVGRVDIIAACFYLLSFNCCLSNMSKPSKRFQLLAVIAFIFALCSKEMSVGLPVVVAAVAFFWNDGSSYLLPQLGASTNSATVPSPPLVSTLLPRLKFAALSSLPLWITLAAYFIIRLLCLKTLVGGYVGGFGASQLSEMVHHWADPDTIRRLFIPLNNQLYGNNPTYGLLIGATELILATVAFVRVLAGYASWRWFLFLAIWCATAAVPIFQLWGLGFNLEGARFYFFLCMPLSLAVPVLLFHPAKPGLIANADAHANANIEKALYLTGSLATLALLVLLQKAAVQTNMLWVHAGKEVKRFSEACQTLVTTHPGQTKFLILGIPKDNAGAHMILNGTTFDVMLRPPFTGADHASRLLNCDAIMYSPEQYINGAQLRWMLARKDVSGPYVWSVEQQKLLKFNYDTSAPPVEVLQLRTEGAGDGVDVLIGKLNPLDYQVLQFDLKTQSAGPMSGSISWSNAASAPYFVDAGAQSGAQVGGYAADHASEWRTVTIDLGHYWRWYAQGEISKLHIAFPVGAACSVNNVRLLPATACAPSLTLSDTTSKPGIESPYSASVSASPLSLQLKSGAMPGAKSVALEIGRQDYFFDNFRNDGKVNTIAQTNIYPAKTALISLDTQLGSAAFPNPGYYQVRARYLNAEGNAVGVSSDPVTLKLNR